MRNARRQNRSNDEIQASVTKEHLMKKYQSLSVKALLLSLAASSAAAADLATIKGPPPTFSYAPLWTGIYAGLNIGGGWNESGLNGNYWSSTGFNNGVSNRLPSGALGGAQIGYNYQISPRFVAGLETDFQGTTMGSGSSINSLYYPVNRWQYSMGTSLNWYGTVRGRVALAVVPQLLVFGTAGLAYGNVSRNGLVLNGSTQTGWTAGGGAEWMFLPNWSAKLEYLYTRMSGGPTTVYNFYPSYPALLPLSVNNQTAWSTIRAGVNYHFSWGATSSITGASITAPNYDTASLALPSLKNIGASAHTASPQPVATQTVPSTVSASVPQQVQTQVSPIAGLTPATGSLPDISISDIIHQ
jgi:outer membrane immunogenic protein